MDRKLAKMVPFLEFSLLGPMGEYCPPAAENLLFPLPPPGKIAPH